MNNMRTGASSGWRWLLVGLGLLILLVVVAIVALGARKKSKPGTEAVVPPGPTTLPGIGGTGGTTTPPTPGLKPVIRGLIDRNGPPPAGYPISAWVVQVNWSDLQPQQGGPIAANNGIDRAIAQVRALQSHGANMALKLRVYAGIHSPDWAKQLGGPPFPVLDPGSGAGGTAPRFWTPQFGQAYAALEAALAARYDDVPEIREVVVAQCTTVFDEPFQRQVADQASRAAFLAAGYTIAADQACQQAEINAHKVWKKTSSDLAVNVFAPVETGRGPRGANLDLSFPESVMRYCRQQLGTRCVLENNSLKSRPTAAYTQLYQAMKGLGPSITLQTAQSRTVGDLPTVVGMAADIGAGSVELPASYKKEPPSALTSSLGPSVSRLEQNPAP